VGFLRDPLFKLFWANTALKWNLPIGPYIVQIWRNCKFITVLKSDRNSGTGIVLTGPKAHVVMLYAWFITFYYGLFAIANLSRFVSLGARVQNSLATKWFLRSKFYLQIQNVSKNRSFNILSNYLIKNWNLDEKTFWSTLRHHFLELTAFFRTGPLLYDRYGQANLYSLYRPGSQHFQKIIHFLIFLSKKEIGNQKYKIVLIQLNVPIN